MMSSMPDMARPSPTGMLGMTFTMWAVMMVGMMLPSAAPAVLLYATMVRKNGARGAVLPPAWIFISGYLAVWIGFSLAAALLQVALEQAGLITPGLVSASKPLSAAILIGAGIYQWLPLKDVCLRKCRSPLEFFVTRWRSGNAGALRMGAEHGLYCVGCCWALMLLLFVAGVMNLLWVALIAGFVFVEKLLPVGRITGHLAGAGLVLAGIVVLIAA
jgi:predicted metal-binding membrane protein